MERWSGKVAVVTGASAGIGAAIVVALLKADCIVVGLARRIECIEELRKQVSAVQSKNLHAIKCDVTVDADITAAFEWIERHLDGVDILINNAGTPPAGNLVDAGNTAKIRNILETNVMGVVQCTREAFQSMKRRGVDGHVVLMNSICGHSVPYIPGAGSLSIYVPSKYAITGMTEILRQEFHNLKTRVKISSISPGVVDTAMIPDEAKASMSMMSPADVADAVLYVLGTPPHVQVHELMIRPVGDLL